MAFDFVLTIGICLKTRNHHWKIFVNPVGVDAVVLQTVTRCVAGGYVWNPYYTQLADPLNVSRGGYLKINTKTVMKYSRFRRIYIKKSVEPIIHCVAMSAMCPSERVQLVLLLIIIGRSMSVC